ncbi:MAG: 4Fe-4S binding protein [Candidatus Thermoplasmatota archaeon]|nr:4Fe-4S binding protein [Candidatus Thermoplasmatota archaeon]
MCTHGYGCALECVDSCPMGAIEENNGFVGIDEELCDGCGACVDVCPFNAIRLFDGKAKKCDLCGGEPACVSLCSQGALTFEEGKTVDKRVFNEIKKVVEERREDYVLQI